MNYISSYSMRDRARVVLKHYSLHSEDDFRSDYRNLDHQNCVVPPYEVFFILFSVEVSFKLQSSLHLVF